MYSKEKYDSVILVTFKDVVTFEELQQFADDIYAESQQGNDIFVIAVTPGDVSYPSKLADVIKALKLLRQSTNKIQRIYGFESSSNKLLSFFSNLGSQMLGLGSKLVNVPDNEALLERLEKDSITFPKLKSASQHFHTIHDRIIEIKSETTR